MRARRSIILSLGLVVFLMAAVSLEAQTDNIIRGRSDFSNVGNRSGEFLTIPIGSRAVAMGNAYTALADD